MAKQLYEKTRVPGIYKQHARGCAGGMCKCPASFQESVYSARDDKLIRKTFGAQREAEVCGHTGVTPPRGRSATTSSAAAPTRRRASRSILTAGRC